MSENCISLYSQFMHDADDNMTGDGICSFTYDAANRLKTVSSNGVTLVTNFYDAKSRRVKKVTQNATTAFFYDGWNLLEERVAYTNGTTSTIHYYWGKDLSGTLQGAGGVEGLLAVSVDGVFYIPCYDHNGNIVLYVSETGSIAAQYTYDPYGSVVDSYGDFADVFNFGFSTKHHDRETGMIGYQRRFYSPVLGRWLNRDPIEEDGGENLYAFCGNNSVCKFDLFGHTSVSIAMGTEFKEGRLGMSEFISISVTVLEKPKSGGHLNFIQLKRPSGAGWSVDYSGELGPYYYSLRELRQYLSTDSDGHEVMSLYDSPGGALSDDVMFYVAVVEINRSCKTGEYGAIKCYDKVSLVDSRIWIYHPYGEKKYSYENRTRGKGMIPTLKELINKATWSTELCPSTSVEIQ